MLERVSFGGGCVNDTIIHLATPYMPFGGVGNSGMGGYHGKYSFDTFTHYKSVLKKANWLDLPMRYQPYTDGNFKLLKMFLEMIRPPARIKGTAPDARELRVPGPFPVPAESFSMGKDVVISRWAWYNNMLNNQPLATGRGPGDGVAEFD